MSEVVTWRPIRCGGDVKAHLIVAGDILSLCGVAQLEHAAGPESAIVPAGMCRCDDCERIAVAAAELVDAGPRCRVCGCTNDRACVTNGVPCHWVEDDLCSACVGTARDEVNLVQALRDSVAAARARRESKAATR